MQPVDRRHGRSRLRWRIHPDVLGLAWIVVVACAYLSPAVRDGFGFGPADVGRQLSVLTSLRGLVPHNGSNGDLVTQFAAWNLFDWHLLHSGQFPLWNDLTMTGMPQLLNFESGVLSLPSLIGYLVPAADSFFVTVAVKLLLAGTGVYVLCRVLGTGPLAAAFGGAAAMLSGSFSGWLGWAVSGPEAWTGWLLCGVVLAYRRRGPAGPALLAVSTAFAIYAGMPESDALVAIGLGVVVVIAGLFVVFRRRLDLAGVLRAGAGLACGAALGAPLWLPGLAVLRLSSHVPAATAFGLPLREAVQLFAQGYYGLPIRGSYFFGPSGRFAPAHLSGPSNYFQTAAYVGIPVLVLALVGLRSIHRRPLVAGVGGATVVAFLISYRLTGAAPVQRLVHHLGLVSVDLDRMVGVLGFLLAILAAIGLEELVRSRRSSDSAVAALFVVGSLVVVAVLALMWSRVGDVSVATAVNTTGSGPTPSKAELVALRRSSLWWPTAEALVLIVIAGTLAAQSWFGGPAAHGGRRLLRLPLVRSTAGLIGPVLLAAESSFLVFAGVGINSYATDLYPVTPAVSSLRHHVGHSLLGLDGGNTACPPHAGTTFCGIRDWTGLAFYPGINLAYGVAELGGHDPVIPRRYFTAWPVPDDGQAASSLNLFAPSIDSVALARRYGVGYVLVAAGRPPPAGMTPVAVVDGMTLCRVPGSGRFSFVAGTESPTPTGGAAGDRVLSVRHPDDASYDLTVSARQQETLLVGITNTPGWHISTGEGRALAVRPAAGGALLSVTVPAGTRSLVVRYWPPRFTLSIVLALAAALVLIGWSTARRLRRSRG